MPCGASARRHRASSVGFLPHRYYLVLSWQRCWGVPGVVFRGMFAEPTSHLRTDLYLDFKFDAFRKKRLAKASSNACSRHAIVDA